jgi:hypothetical protein
MRSSLVLVCTALSVLFSACSSGGNGPAPAAPPAPPPAPPVNTVPVAFDVAETTNVDEPLEAALNGQDGDGDALTYSITELPTSGNVEILDAATGTFRFTPSPAAFGTDLFRYRVNDGSDNSPEAVATILINRKPLAQDESMQVATSLPASGDLVGTDADGDTVSFTIVTQPANGTIQNLDAATGTFTYNATANFEGTDSFTYQTNDGFADSPPATFTLSVNEWLGTVSFGTADDENAFYGLQIDDEMNLYVTYLTTGIVPGGVSSGGADVALAKVDKSGTVLWQKQWGHAEDENPYQLVRDSDGSLYVAVNASLNDVRTNEYVVKFDAAGDLLWELQIPEPNTINQFYRMAISPNGNLYVNIWDDPRSQLLRITPDGTIAWTKLLGTTDDDVLDPLLIGLYDSYLVRSRDLAVDANEIVYSTISLNYTLTGSAASAPSTMLASFDGNGTILSRLEPLATTAFPASGNAARLRDVRLTGAGNLRVSGDTLGVLVAAELDTAGNEIWSTSRTVVDEGRYGFRGALTADGSSIVSGLSETIASAGANPDIAVTKFDNAGVFQWESILSGVLADGTTDVDDHGGQPVTDANGSVFMLIASDGGAIGSAANQGGLDVVLVKLDGDTGEMIHP